MYHIKNTIRDSIFDGLTVVMLSKTATCETLLITLAKDTLFPEHTSPRDASFIMLKGRIVFSISNQEFEIGAGQNFDFPAHEKHHVLAKEDARFLIIR